MYEKKASITKNLFFNMIKTSSSLIFPLITFPYISRVLHAENVGKINFTNSIISYISIIASLGVTTYAIRECSKVRNEKDKLEKVAGQILSINIFSTLIAYFILFFLIKFWRDLWDYRELILLQSISIVFTTLGADWLNTAMEDFKYITYRTFMFQIISFIAMLIFVHKPQDYYIYAIISVVASSGANIVNIFYRHKYCKVKLTIKIDWKKHLPSILILFVMILSQTIFVNVDTTMIGIFQGDYEVGLYSTSSKIYMLINQAISSILWVFLPQLSMMFYKKDYININLLLRKALSFILTLGIPAAIGVYVLAPDIIIIVAGETYLEAVTSLRILMFSMLFSFIAGYYGNFVLLSSGRDKAFLFSCIIAAIVNFVLNIFLIPKYGFNAAALTTALSQLLMIILETRFIEKEIKIVRKKDLLTGPVLGGIALLFFNIIFGKIFNNIFVKLIICIFFSIIIYFVILVLTKNELVVNVIKKLYRKYKTNLHKRTI